MYTFTSIQLLVPIMQNMIHINKIQLFTFLISSICFSQTNTDYELSISKIDSLSKIESCISIRDFGGSIEAKKNIQNGLLNTETKGTGWGGWKVHSFIIDSIEYKKLSKVEKRKLDLRNYCKLLRADYKKYINYYDNSSEEESLMLYLNNDSIFYVKYERKLVFKDGTKSFKQFSFHKEDMETELKNEEYLANWISKKSKEIIKYWYE